MEKVEKVWGKEIWVVNNDLYCGKILILNKGYQCSLHYHKIKDETFYILEGKVLMQIENFTKVMYPGEAIHIDPRVLHRFSGLEKSKIIEFSTKHFDEDSYRVEKSCKIGEKT